MVIYDGFEIADFKGYPLDTRRKLNVYKEFKRPNW